MKFIKDTNLNFVRVDKIIALAVEDRPTLWAVVAYCDGNCCVELKTFGTEAEARSWLKELVIQIDDELSGRNLTNNMLNQVYQFIKEKRHVEN